MLRTKNKSNPLIAPILICVFTIFAVKFNGEEIYWIWEGNTKVPILLIVSAILFGCFALYIYIKGKKG